MTISYILDELDKILALVGAIFSLILTIWIQLVIHYPTFVTFGVLSFMSCTGYLIIRIFFPQFSISSLDKLRYNNRFYKISNIFFFLLLSYSIISIYLRVDPYIRPLGYFISIAFMATIVANDILFLSLQRSHICFALCKIIIIGMSLQYSQILIFPSVVGVDPWWHQWFTLKILDNAHIPEGLVYSKLPMMHLMIGITSLITDLGYKMATMLSISSLQIISDTLFVFLLGKFLISTKVGLLAALLLEIANYHLMRGCWTIPNTMAATLILPITFILLKFRRDKPFIGNILGMFLMGILILTHAITSMSFAILLFVSWLSFEVYNKLFHQENVCSVTWMICFLFSTVMFAYWMYVSGHILILAAIIKYGFYIPFIEGKYQYLSGIPLLENLFNWLGVFLFFSLSFIGGLYMLSKQFRNSNRVTITIGSMVILCLVFFSIIMEKKIILGRWIYFSQILLAIPLSLSLFLINGIFKNRLIKGFIMSLSIFVLSFFLIMSPVANMDNRIFSPKSGIRYAFTDSELQAGNTISTIYNGSVGADWYYTRLFEYQLDTKNILIDNSLDIGDFRILKEIMIIIREETKNHPLSRPYQAPLTINYNPFLALEEQNFSRIYNSGSASGYLKP